MSRVVVIGGGNVAESISLALHQRGINLIQICARNSSQAERIAQMVGCNFCDDFSAVAEADIYIISVSDNALESVSSELNIGNSIVVHTAGSCNMTLLSKHKNYGVFYPLQTFTQGRSVDFREIPIFIEANQDNTLKSIRELAQQLSNSVYDADSAYRTKLHIAAVFACNFTNHMYALADTYLRSENISFELLKPLIQETTNKLLESDNPTSNQTGPAVRNDLNTMERHRLILKSNESLINIYNKLSNSIWEISKKISRK